MLRRVASSVAAAAVVLSGLLWGAAPASASISGATISPSSWSPASTATTTISWSESGTATNNAPYDANGGGDYISVEVGWGWTYADAISPGPLSSPVTAVWDSNDKSYTCSALGVTFSSPAFGNSGGDIACYVRNWSSGAYGNPGQQVILSNVSGPKYFTFAGPAVITVNFDSGKITAPSQLGTLDTWRIISLATDADPSASQTTTVSTIVPAVDDAGNAIPLITIGIDGNGGKCTTSAVTGYQGTWATAPTDTDCSRSGFVFTGFNTAADGSGIAIAPGGNLNLTTDNTLYAQYTQPRPATAPTDVVATGGYKNVKVSWTAPTDEGTSPVAAYLVQANPGGSTCITNQASADLLTCTYTRLEPGTQYSFKVQALNRAGWSEFSADSNVATPYDLKLDTVSRPEVKFLFIKRGSTLEAQGRTPGLDAGAVLTPVLQLGSDGAFVPLVKDTTKVDGNGNFSWSRKLGKNDNGKPASLYFTYGNDKTTTLTAKLGATIGLPSAPRDVKVTSGTDGITVSWQPPARDGGSPIVEYVMKSDAPAPSWARSRVISCTVKAPVTSCTMKGNVSRLDPSSDYTFSVAAKTERGTSPQATRTWKGQVYSLNIFRTSRSGSDVTLSFTATGWANPAQSFEVQAKVGAAGAWKKQGTARLDPDYVQSIGDWEGQLPKSATAGTEVSYRLKSDRGYSNVVTFRPKSG